MNAARGDELTELTDVRRLPPARREVYRARRFGYRVLFEIVPPKRVILVLAIGKQRRLRQALGVRPRYTWRQLMMLESIDPLE